MRLAGIAKGGYYPAAPEAVAVAFPHVLRGSLNSPIAICDPCCGEGEALKQWAEYLKCDSASVYGIELELNRSETTRQLLPNSNILAPCSAFAVGCRTGSLGFIWCNPPFDVVTGGGMRQELKFLELVTPWLCMDGVMCFVCPEKVAWARPVVTHFLSHFVDVRVIPFPEGHRPYGEVVVIARKSVFDPAPYDWVDEVFRSHNYGMQTPPLVIPSTKGPGSAFRKSLPSQAELDGLIKSSPLHSLLTPRGEVPLASPPLELSKGHLALLLASGVLDGIVSPPDEPPHVVRGTARKVKYVADQRYDETKESTITTIRERIEMTVRVVTSDGKIHTLTSSDAVQEIKE